MNTAGRQMNNQTHVHQIINNIWNNGSFEKKKEGMPGRALEREINVLRASESLCVDIRESRQRYMQHVCLLMRP